MPVIAYTLEVDARRPRNFAVHITAPRTPAKAVEFAIPAWTPGYYQILHYEGCIDRVRARDESGRSLPVSRPSARVWRVSTAEASGRTVTLDYIVAGTDKGLGFFGSMLDTRRQIGYVNGASAFMYLPGLTACPVTLSLTVPEGWKCATPLSATTPRVFSAPSYDDLIDSPLQLGSFDTFLFQVAAVPFRCVVVGDRRADAAKVTRALSRVAGEAVGVFGSAPFKQYLFLFHIGEEGFVGGLEHQNSTVIHLDEPLGAGDDDEFITTSTHELFHAWNVKRIRPVGLGPFDYSQIVRTPSLWFAEGVTDYYADLLPVRAGLRTPTWFAEQLAQRIRQLDTTASRSSTTLEQASNRAWEGQSEGFGGVNYYVKGSLIGCFFDLRIREVSGGERCLDDVLRELDRNYGERDTPYPPDALLGALSRVAGRDQAADYRSYVAGTESIAWEEVFPSAGFVLARQADAFLGVRFVPAMPEDETDESLEGDRPAIVDRVEASSPAAAMGLRAGDRIVEIDGREVNYGLAGALVRSLPAGVPVRIMVLRRGKALNLVGDAGTQFSHHSLQFVPDGSQTPAARRTLSSLFASRAAKLVTAVQDPQ